MITQALMLDAFRSIVNMLVDHPDVNKPNTRVHGAYHRALKVLEQCQEQPAARNITVRQCSSTVDWTDARYPGDYVRMQQFEHKRDRELGDVRIQDYTTQIGNANKHYRVAAFTPGRSVFSPGDTPKMEPDACTWVRTKQEADEAFDQLCALAEGNGWTKLERGQ